MIRSTGNTVAVLTAVCAMMSGGCVSSGTYKAMEQESLQVSRNLDETKAANAGLEEKNRQLVREGEAVGQRLKNLEAEIALVRQENGQLKLEREKLNQAVKPENLLRTLQDSFAALQAENARLKQEIAGQAPPGKEQQQPVKLTPVLNRPKAPGDEPGESGAPLQNSGK